MIKKIAITAALSLWAGQSMADFQWELGASYLTGDFDSEAGDADIDELVVNGSWYFEPVSTSEGPLGEAKFFDRASSINVVATDGEIDYDGDDVDISTYGIDTRWVFNREAGWLVDLGYEFDEEDGEETDSFTLGGGKYIFEETLVTLSYTYSDPDNGDDIDAYEVELEHSFELGHSHFKIEAAYEYEDPSEGSDADIFLGRIIYYPRKNLGFGADYERIDEEENFQNWSVFGRWFVTESFAVIAIYRDFEVTHGSEDVDGDAVFVNALVRF